MEGRPLAGLGGSGAGAGWRVFVSHTSELRDFPAGMSYVAAVERAVSACGHVIVDMADFPATGQVPAELCAERVRGCDVYVGVLGTRYGSPVRDRPEVSYTELEFEAATEAGLDRLVFLLDETAADVGIPLSALLDHKFGARQDAFRRRVQGSGLVTVSFTSPVELGQLVERSLRELAEKRPGRRPPERALRVWNIPARNPGFTGREGLLVAIRGRLLSGDRAVVQALLGMAGVGKTQLAVEYAHRFAETYDVAWWINAKPGGLIGDQFAGLATELGFVEADVEAELRQAAVLAELRKRGRWLLIFDGAESPEDVAPWLPGGTGHVLVTTREPGWAEIAAPIEVDVLDRTESVAILQDRVMHLSATDADRLAAELGDLPLAISQAAAFMAETGMAAAEYLNLLRRRAGQLLDTARPTSYPLSLAAVTQLIADRLEHEDPAAAELANMCALLAPEPIPHELFTDAASDLPDPLAVRIGDSVAWRQTLAHLAQHSLARVDDRGLQMHRLTQAILREGLTPEKAATTRARTEALLAASDPGDPADPITWPKWAALMPHLLAVDLAITDNPALRRLAYHTCEYLLARGDVPIALDFASGLYQQSRGRLGGDHAHTLIIALYLASALRAMGRYAEARYLNQDTLARQRRVLGEDHPQTLAAAGNLAADLRALGEVQAARDLDLDALDRRRRVLGEDHPQTLAAAGNLAADLRALGEVQAARDLDQDALDRRRRVLGEDHPDTLLSASNLAADLRALGEVQAARDLDLDALDRRRRVLGEDHPQTLAAAGNLAADLRALGEVQAARDVDQNALARRQGGEDWGGSEADAGGGEPPRFDGGPDAVAPPPEDGTDAQLVNFWIRERESTPNKPLIIGTAYTGVFLVGNDLVGNLATGQRNIPTADIPSDGLDTTWIVSSGNVALIQREEGGVDEVTRETFGNEEYWTARFRLRIPPVGNSEKRLLIVVPRQATARLDVTIYVRGDVYRKLWINLESQASAAPLSATSRPPQSGSPRSIAHRGSVGIQSVLCVPAAEVGIRTPPGRESLTLGLHTGFVYRYLQGEGRFEDQVPWVPNPAAEQRISEVRGALDMFRQHHTAWFDSINCSDLDHVLEKLHASRGWSAPAAPDSRAVAAWDSIACDSWFRRLAFSGNQLFDAFFPPGSAIRQTVLALHPGDRIHVAWFLEEAGKWIPHVPWALMYMGPIPENGQPVDAEQFLGLRFRLSYSSRAVAERTRALGLPDQSTRAQLLYWGGNANDPVAEEALRHGKELASFITLVLPKTLQRKDEICRFLAQPKPTPVTLIYLYCQGDSRGGAAPVLRFGSTNATENVVELMDIGTRTLQDQPLVFVNACESAASDPFIVNELEESFLSRGSRAFIGTETRVPVQFAARFARVFFYYLYRGETSGEALALTRRFFWNQYRSIGGLFYSYVNDYELIIPY